MGSVADGELSVGSSGARLHGRIEGREGAPWLTCLHSLATDLHLWDGQAPALAEHFRVLRLDMRGHGVSTSETDNFSIEDLRDDVAAVWDALQIGQSAVLGLSIGGMIALALGLEMPQRVSRIAAADCRADAPPAFRSLWDERQRLLREEGMDAVVAATLPTWFTAATLESGQAMVSEVTQMITGTSASGYLGATRALQGLDLLPQLPGTRVPVLYVVGADDGVHPEAMAAMRDATPGSTLRVLPNASHLANLEQPQLFLAAVLPFLRGEVAECP